MLTKIKLLPVKLCSAHPRILLANQKQCCALLSKPSLQKVTFPVNWHLLSVSKCCVLHSSIGLTHMPSSYYIIHSYQITVSNSLTVNHRTTGVEIICCQKIPKLCYIYKMCSKHFIPYFVDQCSDKTKRNHCQYYRISTMETLWCKCTAAMLLN